jgi:hypothetical protein
MFLKCFNVIASPAAMAGKYNRSRQFNRGRRTVIVISTHADARARNRARVQLSMSRSTTIV